MPPAGLCETKSTYSGLLALQGGVCFVLTAVHGGEWKWSLLQQLQQQ